MKSLFLLLGYFLWIVLIISAFLNLDNISSISIINAKTSAFLDQYLHINMPVNSVNIKTPVLFLILFLAGECAGRSFLISSRISGQEKLQAYKRELEKGSVTNSASTSKIEVLENKIQVLEKALNDALKRNGRA